MACVDTTALLDAIRPQRADFRRRLEPVLADRLDNGETLFTSRFNEAELWVGIERARDRENELRRVTLALSAFVMLDFDLRAVRHFGRIKAHLLSIGRPSGDMDLLIASVALANGEGIVTRNPRHFADIPDLLVFPY
jgi:tRNA(fMet)-specific endonuclease VapC